MTRDQHEAHTARQQRELEGLYYRIENGEAAVVAENLMDCAEDALALMEGDNA